MGKQMTPPLVSVVVVSYNTQEKLRRCLGCIEAEHEVIVVDNASSDGSPDIVARDFPRVHLIRNQQNRGFGEANNQGLAAATGNYVLFLNSDAYAYPGAIQRLAEEMREDVIAVGGRQLNLDDSLQDSSANELTLWAVFCEQTGLEKIFRTSRLLSPYWNTRRLSGVSEVDQVMGATLMVNWKQIQQTAGSDFRSWTSESTLAIFDPRYFLYCEDTDLCKRLRRLGRILYVPEALFIHELGSSSGSDRWRSVARYNRGKELYFQLHHGPNAAAFCLVLDRWGAMLRFLIWILMFPLGTGRMSLFWKVLTAPLAGPPDPRL